MDIPKAQSSRNTGLLLLIGGILFGVFALATWACESWLMRTYLQPDPVELFATFVAEDAYSFTGIPCRVIVLGKRLPVNFSRRSQSFSKIQGVRGFEVILHLPSKTLTVVAYGDSRAPLNQGSNFSSGRILETYGRWPDQTFQILSHRTWLYSLFQLENLRWGFQGKSLPFTVSLFQAVHNTFSVWTGGGKPHKHYNPMPALWAKATERVYWYSTVMIFFIWASFLSTFAAGVWLAVLYGKVRAIELGHTLGPSDGVPDFSFAKFLFSSNLPEAVRQWREAVIKARTSKLGAIEIQRIDRKKSARLAISQVSVANNMSPSKSLSAIREQWFQNKTKLFLEIWESSGDPNFKAWELYQRALAKDMELEWGDKRYLIKAAIELQRLANEKRGRPSVVIQASQIRGAIIAPVVRISLANRVDAEFPDLTAWIRPGVDAEMVRAIILQFLNLGRDGSCTFQNTYFAETHLRNGAKKRYEIRNGRGSHDPTRFTSALSWLVNIGVVMWHAKEETGYCLCSHERDAVEQGKQILKAVKAFVYSFKRPA